MSTAGQPAAAAPGPRLRRGSRCRGRGRSKPLQVVILLALLALLGVAGPAGPAGPGIASAQTTEGPDEPDTEDDLSSVPRLELEEQTTWTRPGEDFAARIRLPVGHGGAVVSAQLHEPVSGVGEVAATSRGEELGPVVHRLADVEVPAAAASAVIRVPVGSAAGRVELEPGVYPLVVRVATEGIEAPEPLVIHVVVVADDQTVRRPLALVAPVDQPFRWTADGRLRLEGGPEVLVDQLAPLAAHPAVPFTLLPTPGTVAALADTADGARALELLGDVVQRGQVLNGPFARLPAGAWTAARLDQPLVDQFAAGQAALTGAFGGPPSGSAWLVSPTDDLTLLRWLSARGVNTFLVPPAAGGTEEEADPTPDRFRIDGLDGAHLGLTVRPVGGTLEPDPVGGPVAEGHRVLAEVALPALGPEEEGDEVEDGEDVLRPAVLLLDNLGPETRSVLAPMLAALDQPGPLRPVTVAELGPRPAGRPAGDELPSWELPAPARPDLGSLPGQLSDARRQLDSFVATVGPSDPAVAQLERGVLALGAADLTAADRAAVLAAIGALARSQLGTVELDRDQPVTVTSHRADVPVAIQNRGSRPLDVALRVESSDLEITGPAVRLLRLQPGAITDVAVPVRVNRSGDFRVTVEVSSPDGQLLLASRTLTVRSTAISGVGVVLSVGALAFLFLWWGRHARRTRRARPALTVPTRPESPRVEEPVP